MSDLPHSMTFWFWLLIHTLLFWPACSLTLRIETTLWHPNYWQFNSKH